MLTAMVVALFAGVVFLDYMPGWSSRKKKENIVYGMLLAVSFGILMLYSLGVPVPSPSKAIQDFIMLIVPAK